MEIPEPDKRIDYYPHQLSGGQKQRVVIALALANDPVLLLADEPTTALDVTVQAEILPLLRRLRDQTNTGILLITHNLGVVADIADSVVVLQLGEVVERGEVTEFFARPEHVYTRHLLDSVLRLPQPSEIAEQVAEVADASTPVLDVDTVSVVYPGRRGQAAFRALDHVSLKLAAGEVLGVVGESGSGKTTLGRTIAGLIPPATGTIRVDGRDVSTTSGSALRELRRRLAFVPQDPAASLDPHFTLEESIAEPLDIHRVGTRGSGEKRLSTCWMRSGCRRRLPQGCRPSCPAGSANGSRWPGHWC